MKAFDQISGEYKKKALVQQKAARKLIELLNIGKMDSVLDVACGPGHISHSFSDLTSGRVVGTDISEEMIAQARVNYPGEEFYCVAAEDIDCRDEFDIVFCNSAIQWFKQPEKAVRAMHTALKFGGRLGLANPATNAWSPFLIRIVAAVTARADIAPTFAYWKNPWFFLPTEADYRLLFERCGFTTSRSILEKQVEEYSLDAAYGIYLSGAANGYAAKMFYSCDVSDEYIALFNGCVREEIEKMSANGRVLVDFNRLFYIGMKQ